MDVFDVVNFKMIKMSFNFYEIVFIFFCFALLFYYNYFRRVKKELGKIFNNL